jgi:hypothetical protein
VTTLALKLVLAPVLIVGASLAGRRWGGAVSGWLVGLPLTSGPVSLLLALEHGRGFAARGAVGSLVGVIGEAAFFVVWGAVVRRGWLVSVALGSLVFAAIAGATQALRPSPHAPWPLLPLVAAILVALVATLRLLPTPARAVAPLVRPPRWDLPARAIVATALVLALTSFAATLGARLTGLLAVYPLYSIVLTGFAQHLRGPDAAVRVLRGVTVGLFAFTAFFVTLALLLPHVTTAPAYVAAAAAALAVQAASLGWVRAAPSASASCTSSATTPR